jgi:hypothetical protein
MLYAANLICRFKSQDLFNTEPFKPFIPGLKLWAFWASIFIKFFKLKIETIFKLKDTEA